MKTPVQWVTELRSDKQPPNERQIKECAAIQADAWRQGMSDAATIAEGTGTKTSRMAIARRIRLQRDKRK